MSASRHPGVGYTAGTVPIAVIAFDFDPLVRILDDVVVRWQTLALAAVIAACLVVAGVMARRGSLRGDDLLFIAIGAVPGAVILGRVGYGLAHLDAFGTDPFRLLDPAVGGLDLAMGVVGGVLAGAYVASLLESPIGRWAHVLALPLLVAIGAGKLTMVLGGSGQGSPSDAAWATAFLGPGPWGSLAPALPSHPSQVYEGVATLGYAVILAVRGGVRGHRPSRWPPAPGRDRRMVLPAGGRIGDVARPRGRRARSGRLASSPPRSASEPWRC